MFRSVDEIIREAMQHGEFENLSNKGKKLDLGEYFNMPEDVRLGYGLLKDNNFVPEEVQMLKEIEARRLKYNLLVERSHRHR